MMTNYDGPVPDTAWTNSMYLYIIGPGAAPKPVTYKYMLLAHCELVAWNPGLILGLCPANKRWRYFVTTSLIGGVQT